MRAIVIAQPGGPEVLRLGQAPDPSLADGDVLVRVAAAGVNRADLLQRRGHYPAPPGVPQDIPGLEYAGTIESAPAGSQWRRGDRVMGLVGGGAYAEFVATPADQVLPVPEGWSFADAAAVPEAYLTAFDALVLQAGLGPGERALIHAIGSGVGVAALGIAKAQGAEVAGTSRTKSKLERARTLGLDHAVLVSGAFMPDAALTNWANVIAELVGGPYLAGDLAAVAPRGRIVVIGLTGGREAPLNLGTVLSKRVTIIGTVLRTRDALEKTLLVKRFREVGLPWLVAGTIRPVLSKAFPMADAAEAHRYLEANSNFGSVVLSW
ncbi:MAG TPA: NAD(P)H-quinone oxidoreductase [Gemmatimonadales bacterium]